MPIDLIEGATTVGKAFWTGLGLGTGFTVSNSVIKKGGTQIKKAKQWFIGKEEEWNAGVSPVETLLNTVEKKASQYDNKQFGRKTKNSE